MAALYGQIECKTHHGKKKIEGGLLCRMCTNNLVETRDHLLFECSFTVQCWNFLNIHWDMSAMIFKRIQQNTSNYAVPCFMEILVCATWNIWKVRNDQISKGVDPSMARWKVHFQSDIQLYSHRVKAYSVQALLDWLQSPFISRP
jgi:hypothetical protein